MASITKKSENKELVNLQTENERLKKSIEDLWVINQLARIISSTMPIKQILENVASGAVKAIGTEQGTIDLLEEAKSEDPFKTLIRKVDSSSFTEKYRLGEDLSAWMIKNRKALMINDTSQDTTIHGKHIKAEGIRSILSVPLLTQGKLIGVLNLFNKKGKGEFSKNDQRLLSIIASQSAQAIENARLYGEERQLLANLEQTVSELEKANEELRELDRRKSEFLSTVSHELRTPLSPIKSCLENILSGIYGAINEKQRTRLEMALASVNDETRLIENLLDVVRIQENRVSLDLEYVSISDIVQSVIQVFEYEVRNKKIELNAQMSSADRLETQLDSGKIKQVITNLLHNAIKFTPPKGTVKLSARRKARWIKVKITDTGIGIPESQLEKIFDRFYQVDSSLTRKVGGTGIGLNISKKYIELHGGQIWAERNLHSGSTFSFTLPKHTRDYK